MSSSPYASEEVDSEGDGDWKGRVISLFSPVLKFVGGNQEYHQEHHETAGKGDVEGGMVDHEEEEDSNGENDLNWENTSGYIHSNVSKVRKDCISVSFQLKRKARK